MIHSVHAIQRFVGLVFAALLLALGGFATLDGVATSTLDRREVEHVVLGHGSPNAVFENGLGASLQWWSKALPEEAKTGSVFAHNTAGTGGSTEPTSVWDGDTTSEELRSKLRAKGLPPLYVLVSDSLGWLYMQLYTRSYPQNVAGLTLVDSAYPAQMKGAGSKGNWPAWMKVMLDVSTSAIAQKELDSLTTTGASLLAMLFANYWAVVAGMRHHIATHQAWMVRAYTKTEPKNSL